MNNKSRHCKADYISIHNCNVDYLFEYYKLYKLEIRRKKSLQIIIKKKK